MHREREREKERGRERERLEVRGHHSGLEFSEDIMSLAACAVAGSRSVNFTVKFEQ